MVSQMERTFRGRSREYEDLSMSFCDISIPQYVLGVVTRLRLGIAGYPYYGLQRNELTKLIPVTLTTISPDT